jgi:hypothetical protein
MNKILRIPRLRNVGQLGLARHKGWLRGRIGRVEHQVCYALINAHYERREPVGTGWLVREVYRDAWDKDAPPFRPRRWMFLNVRKACEVYAERVGRAERGRGRPGLWRLKDDVSNFTIREWKTARDAKRRRKLARGAARKKHHGD